MRKLLSRFAACVGTLLSLDEQLMSRFFPAAKGCPDANGRLWGLLIPCVDLVDIVEQDLA